MKPIDTMFRLTSKLFFTLLIATSLLVTTHGSASQKHKRTKLGVQSLQVVCDEASTKGRTTEVLLSNNSDKSALVVFEYRQPADKSGRTNTQNGLRYEIGSKQSLSLDCDDLLSKNDRESTTLAMTVSAFPFEGVSVIATYKSMNSDSICTSTILPIDNLTLQPVGTEGKFCSGCSLNSNGICCAGLCCEGDCIDGECQANSFTTVDDDF